MKRICLFLDMKYLRRCIFCIVFFCAKKYSQFYRKWLKIPFLFIRGQNEKNFVLNIKSMEAEDMVKECFVVGTILFLLLLYCCLVQGKKEDEVIDKLYREKWRTDVGKDEE